jgi:hypothetical protein
VHPWGGGEDVGLPGSTEGGLPDVETLTLDQARPGDAYHGAWAQLGLEPAPSPEHDSGPDVSGWREQMGS